MEILEERTLQVWESQKKALIDSGIFTEEHLSDPILGTKVLKDALNNSDSWKVNGVRGIPYTCCYSTAMYLYGMIDNDIWFEGRDMLAFLKRFKPVQKFEEESCAKEPIPLEVGDLMSFGFKGADHAVHPDYQLPIHFLVISQIETSKGKNKIYVHERAGPGALFLVNHALGNISEDKSLELFQAPLALRGYRNTSPIRVYRR